MNRFQNLSAIFVFGVLPLIAACGKSNPIAPTELSPGSPSPGSTGATIAGVIAGSNGSAAQSGHFLTSGTTIVVSVVGTNISVQVDATGRFQLNGVPTGDVILQFSSPAGTARLTIPAVADRERIELSVSLNGTTVVVITMRRDKAEDQIELEGRISSVPTGCPTPVFIVNGTTIRTNSATTFSGGGCSAIVVGADVEVKGARQSDGSILATRVSIEDDNEDEEIEVNGAVSGLTGSCPNLTFMVNGTTVATNSATRFERSCGSVQNGRKVEVEGVRQLNGSVLARKVEVDDDEHEQQEIELKGSVSGLAGACPTLTFVVNGTTVLTNSATRFEHGSCGAIQNGKKVEVKGIRQANGNVLATKVELD